MLTVVEIAVALPISAWIIIVIVTHVSRWKTRRRYGVASEALVVGFFHPFCAGGGGGERVLWRAVHNLAQLSKDLGRPLHVLIYTGDLALSPKKILSGVLRQFQISIEPSTLPVSFVYLRGRWLLGANLYPVLTMLAQSVASMLIASEALARATPDVFVDTTGFAFTFPVAWLAGCRVGAYVHYPTISTDMLSRVRDQRPSHNNSSWITSSTSVSRAKLLYYKTFASLYGFVGGFASTVMVNSSWTRGHVAALWKRSSPTIVYPPCDTSELESLPINDKERQRCVLSVGQFRPEKDHALQVRALAALRKIPDGRAAAGGNPDHPFFDDVRLVILGGCRNDGDKEVLTRTRALAAELGLEDRVEFVVNCSFEELKAWLGRGSVGLHTMWNEHFGIGVVEMMAAGLVTIAHRSGGPAADIVVPLPDGRVTGFLAETPEEYAAAMARIFRQGKSSDSVADNRPDRTETDGGGCDGLSSSVPGTVESFPVRVAGRESARRFSNKEFDARFASEFAGLLQPSSKRSHPEQHGGSKED